jgi:hypothetical protein
MIWQGYAGTVAKVDGVDAVVSTFEHPQWTMQGELTARFVCSSSKKGGVLTLARSPEVFVTALRVRREGTALPHAPQLYLLRTGSSAARLISAAALR